MSVTWKDTGYRRVMNGLTELTRYVVRVGVLNEDSSRIHPLRSTMTVGTVARIQEYGSPNAGIPQRSFLRSTVHERHTEVRDALVNVIQGIVAGSSSWAGLFNLGEKFKRYVEDKIKSGNIPPPLAQYTVDKKGHSRTLQDTDTLAGSISHETITRAAANSGSNEDVF